MPVWSVAFSPNNDLLASGSGDHTVKVWDTTMGALQQTLEGHLYDVNSVAFSPDGRLLASGSGDHTVPTLGRHDRGSTAHFRGLLALGFLG